MSSKNRNIIFIGGIHGVGKSTVCQYLSSKYPIQHLSASELIKWAVANEKEVANINANQDRLINGLQQIVKHNNFYLLDGHYCLINSKSSIDRVPFETFEKINPILFVIITAEVEDVLSRLKFRDGKKYQYSQVEEMLLAELEYAQELAEKLDVKLLTITSGNMEELEREILQMISN